ncbi:MAG: response regulator [Acetatifactor sp.]|nr:response regulator [Acetatifactor sp.]
MLRAVIVDDESLIIRSLKTMIERSDSGIEVAGTADDGLTGLQLIRDLKPDIVFADITMPIMSGLQLIEICRRENNDVPFVILSGYREFEYAKKAIALDVLEYLVKPINPLDFKQFLVKTASDLKIKKYKEKLERIESAVYSEYVPNDDALEANSMKYTLWHICVGMVSFLRKMGVEQADDEAFSRIEKITKEYFEEKVFFVESRYLNEGYLIFENEDKPDHAKMRSFFEKCEKESGAGNLTLVFGGDEIPPADFKKAITGSEQILRDGAVFLSSRMLFSKDDIPTQVYVGDEEIRILCGKLSENNVKEAVSFMRQLLERCKAGSATQKSLQKMLKHILRECNDPGISAEAEYYAGLIMEEASSYEDVEKGFEALFEEDSDKVEFKLNDKSCHAILDAIAAYLSEHYTEKIVIQEVAEKFGFNYTYFSYLFKKVYAQSPSEYVIQRRIENAKQMLKQSDEVSVKEVALSVGYSDPYYFSRIFKTITGLTPSEYRKAKRGTGNQHIGGLSDGKE